MKKDVLKNGISFGIRALKMSKRSIGKSLAGFVRKGYLPKKEVETIFKKIVSAGRMEQKRLVKLAEKEGKKVLREIGVVSLSEAKLMKIRLKGLENLVKKEGKKIAKKFR